MIQNIRGGSILSQKDKESAEAAQAETMAAEAAQAELKK